MSKAAVTRHTILQSAFELIYRNGFKATSIDTIIATTQVTKGAFFYHFRDKEEMGSALINEIIRPTMEEVMVKPLLHSNQPVDDIYAMMKHLLLEAPFFQVNYGCPAVNLVNELATSDTSLHRALSAVINQCLRAVSHCIQQGKVLGHIRNDIDEDQVATFIMIGYSGARNMGKLLGSATYQAYLAELKLYLHELA